MKVLVIGRGGREHCLARSLAESDSVERVFWTPGNGASTETVENPGIPENDFDALAGFVRGQGVDLAVVGPEAPLVAGIADRFREEGLTVFGPSAAGARIEGSKLFAKQLMQGGSIPTAAYRKFTRVEEAVEHMSRSEPPFVIKADGLAAGKGVSIVRSVEEGREMLRLMLEERVFGESGSTVVVEEYLSGEEATMLALCDGERVIPLISSQDHKQVFDGDTGPNTGGMGAIAPAPVVTPKIMGRVVERILLPLVEQLREAGIHYRGIIYAGLMVSEGQPRVVEFNCRFGDPEAEAVIPLLESDLGETLYRTAVGDLGGLTLHWKRAYACDVVMASGGYPGPYTKNMEISGLETVEDQDLLVYHAGTRRDGDRVFTDGGRVLNVVGVGDTLRGAVDRAYRGVEAVTFQDAHYRRDIGFRGLRL